MPRPSPSVRSIEPGAVYRRVHGSLQELARVTSIADEPFGIPHVRFTLSYCRSDKEEPQGDRILALSVFASRYGPCSNARAPPLIAREGPTPHRIGRARAGHSSAILAASTLESE